MVVHAFNASSQEAEMSAQISEFKPYSHIRTKTVADKVAQQVKALAIRPDHLTLIPRTDIMEEEK